MNKNHWILVALLIAFLVGFFMGTSNWSPAQVANAQTATAIQQPPPVAMQLSGNELVIVRGDSIYMYQIKQNQVNPYKKDFISIGKTTLK
jgi:hypothetical protein